MGIVYGGEVDSRPVRGLVRIELLEAEGVDFELAAVAFGFTRFLRRANVRGFEVDQFPLAIFSLEDPIDDAVDDAVCELQREGLFDPGRGIGEQASTERRSAEAFQKVQQILPEGLLPLGIWQGMGQEEEVDAGSGILAGIEGEFLQERVGEFAEEERAAMGLVLGSRIPGGDAQNIAMVVVLGRLLEEDEFGDGEGWPVVLVHEGLKGAEIDGPFPGVLC